jgi:hypothetical protein
MYGIRSSRCYIYYATVFWTIAITPASMIIKGRPIFDIIAGTSIGAINAAILVSYVVENQTCEGVHYDKIHQIMLLQADPFQSILILLK